jgi:hypothetical protein
LRKKEETMATALCIEELSIADLEARFAELVRTAAEVAFAIAIHHHGMGDKAGARTFGSKSLALFRQCDTSSEVKCCTRNEAIGGIALPGLTHGGVVASHMKRWGVL